MSRPTLLQSATWTSGATPPVSNTQSVTFTNPLTDGSQVFVVAFAQDPTNSFTAIPQFQTTSTPYIGSSNGIVSNVFAYMTWFQDRTVPGLYYQLFSSAQRNNLSYGGVNHLDFTSVPTTVPVAFIAFEIIDCSPTFAYSTMHFSTADVISNNYVQYDAIAGGTGSMTSANVTGFTSKRGQNLYITAGGNSDGLAMTGTDLFTSSLSTTVGTLGVGMAFGYSDVITTVNPQFTMPSSTTWGSWLVDFYSDNPAKLQPGNLKSATSATSSVTATLPHTATVGNTLLASVYSNSNTSSIAGWTKMSGDQLVNFSGSDYVAQFSKIADGTETTVTATSTGSSLMELHVYEFVTGAATVTYASAGGGSSGSAVNTLSLLVVTAASRNMLFGSLGLTTARTFTTGVDSMQTNNAVTGLENATYVGLTSPHLWDYLEFCTDPYLLPENVRLEVLMGASSNAGMVINAITTPPAVPDPLVGTLTTLSSGL
jgi:hypothetical protein